MEAIRKMYSLKLLEDSIYFKIGFILWALLDSITLGAYVTRYFSIIFIIWGALLLFKNLVLEKWTIKKKYVILLILFSLSYLITIIYNREFNFIGNIKTLIWISIMSFVVFWNEGKEKIFKDVRKIANVFNGAIFVLAVIGIIMFCFDIAYDIEKVDGRISHQGFWAGRLWGVYVDPNQAATIAIISIITSLIILFLYKNNGKTIKIFSIVNIFIQYIFIILTGSRGGEIAFIAVLAGLIYLAGDYLLRNSLRNDILRRGLMIIIGGVVAISIIITFNPSRKLLGKIPTLTVEGQKLINNKLGIEVGKNNGSITMARPDVGEGKDVSNGRITLWIDGLKLSKYSPVLGFGDRNLFLQAKRYTPGSTLETQYVHNGFIHLLLSGGLIGLGIIVVLLVFAFIDVIKIVFGSKVFSRKYYIYCFMALIVATGIITAMFLTELFYQNSIISTMFWIFMGFVTNVEKVDLV